MPRKDRKSTSSATTSAAGVLGARPMRLQRFLAAAGLGSRRSCEELIVSGRVTVDGHVVTELGTTIDPTEQHVQVDGETVRLKPRRYVLLNKPRGVLCTHRDPDRRRRVYDLVPRADEDGLFAVGRLDENTEGLLLLTNDGELAERLAHPRHGVPRVYRVQVAGLPTGETLKKLKRGLYFSDGRFRFQRIRRLGKRGRSTFLEVTLAEGRNREVRRLFARVGHKVMHLKRMAFGPLRLGHLPTGRYRELTAAELRRLREWLKRAQRHERTASNASQTGDERPDATASQTSRKRKSSRTRAKAKRPPGPRRAATAPRRSSRKR
ncbi:MAG: rRNA pseudouridine synthase [Planctomycetota bacterium]|nr:MAG: rRNA pseudouridine synthase [Planctomycetota bacterium]